MVEIGTRGLVTYALARKGLMCTVGTNKSTQRTLVIISGQIVPIDLSYGDAMLRLNERCSAAQNHLLQ